jgi:hypothetical protein
MFQIGSESGHFGSKTYATNYVGLIGYTETSFRCFPTSPLRAHFTVCSKPRNLGPNRPFRLPDMVRHASGGSKQHGFDDYGMGTMD